MEVLPRKGIPEDVLYGRVKEYKEVFFLYRKEFYTRFMQKLHKSFYDRALGGTDDYGNWWYELKVMTDIIKLDQIAEGKPNPQFTGNFTNKRQLSPDQFKQYKENYRKFLEEGKKHRTSERHSLKFIDGYDRGSRVDAEGNRVPKTLINVRTSRLASALFPGEVANNRIYGGPDQDFTLEGLNIEFSLRRIEYADRVDRGIGGDGQKIRPRPIFTPSHMKALREAHDEAITKAREKYDQIRTRMRRNNADNRNTENRRR